MIQITPQMRILVAVESVDFRKGIDSLAELCRQKLDADPFSGYLFVSAAGEQPLLGCWSMTGRDSGWRPSGYRKGASAGGPGARERRGCYARIKRRCCWRQATRTSTRRRCGAK